MTDQSTPPADSEGITALRQRLARAERRVDSLERMLVSGYCVAVGAVLVAGLLLPFLQADADDEDSVSYSVLTAIVSIREDSGDAPPGAFGVAFAVGFIGLILVVLALLLLTLPAAARGDLADRRRTLSKVLVTLGAIGSGVVVLLSLAGLQEDVDQSPGPGGWVLLLGVLGAGLLLGRSAEPLVAAPPAAIRRTVR
jgi:MFS family permease